MSSRIQLTRDAEKDLDEIFAYISGTLLSPEAAIGQLERLEQRIASLERLPKRYRVYEKEPWKSRGLRVMPVDNYLVFYVPDSETVTVLRILYGGRDIEKHL